MPDPFQNVSAAGPEFIAEFAEILENRAQDPTMVPIIDAYLDEVDWVRVSTAVEVGSGTGPIARKIAVRAPAATVTGIEPASEFVDRAKLLADSLSNLTFVVGDGASLPFGDGSVDLVVMHTVLSHVIDPSSLLVEAARVLGAGGTLVVCDADFSKASLANISGDPLQGCVEHFVRTYVTHPHLTGTLRKMVSESGFKIASFSIENRLITDSDAMRSWVSMAGNDMMAAGLIGQSLADELVAEYDRRLARQALYGFQLYATLIANKAS